MYQSAEQPASDPSVAGDDVHPGRGRIARRRRDHQDVVDLRDAQERRVEERDQEQPEGAESGDEDGLDPEDDARALRSGDLSARGGIPRRRGRSRRARRSGAQSTRGGELALGLGGREVLARRRSRKTLLAARGPLRSRPPPCAWRRAAAACADARRRRSLRSGSSAAATRRPSAVSSMSPEAIRTRPSCLAASVTGSRSSSS